MKLTRFQKVILVSIGIVIFLAYMDTQGFAMWQTIGGFAGEAYTKAEPAYMQFFWMFAFALIGIIALVYYLMHKDKSEAVALVALPLTLIWSGAEDVIYYILGGHKFFGTTMPWLYENCFFMRWVAQLMGKTTVDSTSLMVSLGLGIIISFYLYKWLKQAKW